MDTVIGRAATKVEIAEAKVNALEAELESFYAAEREAQTAADLAGAQQLAEEARQLIAGDYAKAAREIAETLARLVTIETELRALNARLPACTGYIQIEAVRSRSSVGRSRCPPSVRTTRPFGQRDLDVRRSTRSTRGADGVTSTPVFGGNAQRAVIRGRIGSVRCRAAPFDERTNSTDDGLPGRVPDKGAEREPARRHRGFLV